jgi:Putative DNA-binding domain
VGFCIAAETNVWITMIFLERPITVQHIRDICAHFDEGIRVEYKSIFDASVKAQLPKIVSSFANSQGGVMVVGIRTLNGVPQGPFEGFTRAPREEYPLTVENVCLQNIHPPVFPKTSVIESDTPNQIFLVIEVDESGEGPHAIENSKKVYVRTGNAANPYDLADVNLIIDLLKRRREPLERRDRLLKLAEQRSEQCVRRDVPYVQLAICPAFPRTTLCSPREVWELLMAPQFNMELINVNYMKRVPAGAAGLIYHDENRRHIPAQYVEVTNFGFMFAARHLALILWNQNNEMEGQQIVFRDLIQPLIRLAVLAERFYSRWGYGGNLTINVHLHHVQGIAMRFVPANHFVEDHPDDFRCYTDEVSVERLVTIDEIRGQRIDVLTGILTELTWAFWQRFNDHPMGRLRQSVADILQQLGA